MSKMSPVPGNSPPAARAAPNNCPYPSPANRRNGSRTQRSFSSCRGASDRTGSDDASPSPAFRGNPLRRLRFSRSFKANLCSRARAESDFDIEMLRDRQVLPYRTMPRRPVQVQAEKPGLGAFAAGCGSISAVAFAT